MTIWKLVEKLHAETAILAARKGLKLNEVVKTALAYIVCHEEILSAR